MSFTIFRCLFILPSILTIVWSDGQHNFFDPDVGHIRDEVKEHYRIDLDNNTSEQELNWYYFEMHDFDKNLVLDGLEILTAINHVIDSETLKNREVKEIPLLGKDDDSDDPLELIRMHESYRTQIRWNEKFDFDSKIIDKLLEEYDTDNDGFISYTEYIIARRNALKL